MSQISTFKSEVEQHYNSDSYIHEIELCRRISSILRRRTAFRSRTPSAIVPNSGWKQVLKSRKRRKWAQARQLDHRPMLMRNQPPLRKGSLLSTPGSLSDKSGRCGSRRRLHRPKRRRNRTRLASGNRSGSGTPRRTSGRRKCS